MSTHIPSLIIVGPQGCGKTRNAKILKEHFKLDLVIEEPFPSPHKVPEFGALVLCNDLPKSCAHHRVMQYADAVKELSNAGRRLAENDR